jgi:hypothetical protein
MFELNGEQVESPGPDIIQALLLNKEKWLDNISAGQALDGIIFWNMTPCRQVAV